MEDTFHLGIKALIRNAAGEILLLQVDPAKLNGKDNYWDLAGGRVQKGQDVQDTLRREVREETGITDISDVKEVGMVLSNIRIPINNQESFGLILAIYECNPNSRVITLSEEHIAFDWFSPKDAAKLLRIKYPESFCKLVESL